LARGGELSLPQQGLKVPPRDDGIVLSAYGQHSQQRGYASDEQRYAKD